MSEIERRAQNDVTKSNGSLSEILARFPVENLDEHEMEVFTSAQAHVQELEEIARRKGIKLRDSSVNNEEKYRVAVEYQEYEKVDDDGYYPQGTIVGVLKGETTVWKHDIVEPNALFANKRVQRAIKKANKLADKLNKGLIK